MYTRRYCSVRKSLNLLFSFYVLFPTQGRMTSNHNSIRWTSRRLWPSLYFLVLVKILQPILSESFDTAYYKYVIKKVSMLSSTDRKSSSYNDWIDSGDVTSIDANPTSNIVMTIPIFPLRKKVRLPTEELQLNLYEDRYIQLAEYVYRQKSEGRQSVMTFGAIYSSDKPQLVTDGGYGPVVPIIQQGDIGVLYIVSDWIERLSYRQPQRRVVQMNARGGLRFRICHVINDGSNTTNTDTTPLSSNKGNDPFILARVELFFDERMVSSSTLQQQLQRTLHVNEQERMNNFGLRRKIASLFGIGNQNAEQKGLSKINCDDILSYEQVTILTNQTVELIQSGTLENKDVQVGYYNNIWKSIEREFTFFAKVTKTVSDVDSTRRLQLLQDVTKLTVYICCEDNKYRTLKSVDDEIFGV
jgi:Lon protease-like protein